MEQHIQLVIFVCLLFSVITGIKHHQKYRMVVSSLESRGVKVYAYKPHFLDTGSGGCMRKIKSIRSEIGVALTSHERALLRSSERYYQVNLICVLPFVLWVLWFLFG